MNRLFCVANVLGKMILVFGFAMLIPLFWSMWMNDGAQTVFGKSVLITVGGGLILWLSTLDYKRELQTKDGFLLVVLVWSVLPAFAMIPFILLLPDLSVSKAYFEAVSGLTAMANGTISSSLLQIIRVGIVKLA